MSSRRPHFAAIVMAICALAGCRDRRAAPTVAEADAAAAAWRTKHEADYRRDWVSISGLATLKPGVNTAGSATTNDIVLPDSTPATVGRFVVGDASVRFEPAAGAGCCSRRARCPAPSISTTTGPLMPTSSRIGEVRLVVHLSGDRRTLRIRDPNGPLARGFSGFTWFPIDSSYRVVGRFVPDAQPQHLPVVNTYADVDTYLSEGVVEFTLQGQTVRLRPFTTRPKRLYFVFRDASSGVETYRTARFLYANLRTTEPPCSISTRPTTRPARSTRTPLVRSPCARITCPSRFWRESAPTSAQKHRQLPALRSR